MSKLVFDAIGKYIHPTRYRQIVETQSLNQLTSEEQRILSEDQKGSKGLEVDNDVNRRLGHSTSCSEPSLETMEKTGMPTKKDKPLSLRIQRGRRQVLKFTAEEDNFLKEGINRHGFGQWTVILRDPDFKFQTRRVADALKKRAELKFLSN